LTDCVVQTDSDCSHENEHTALRFASQITYSQPNLTQ